MQNLTLQVLWLEDSLGLAINQKKAESIVPLTSYYFWPVSKAWEQIRFELDSKQWIPSEERIRILNVAVDVMNCWQQNHLGEKNEIEKAKKILEKETVQILGLA